MKKYLAIVLAVMMLLSAIPASAGAETNGAVVMVPAKTTVQPGETFTVELNVTSNPGVMFFSFTPSFDSTKLELVSMTAKAAGWTCVTNANWDGANDETFTGDMVTITFKAKDAASAGAVTISGSVEAYNYNEDEVPFQVTAGTVTVAAAQAEEAVGYFQTSNADILANLMWNVYFHINDFESFTNPRILVTMEKDPDIHNREFELTYDETRDAYYITVPIRPRLIKETVGFTMQDDNGSYKLKWANMNGTKLYDVIPYSFDQYLTSVYNSYPAYAQIVTTLRAFCDALLDMWSEK